MANAPETTTCRRRVTDYSFEGIAPTAQFSGLIGDLKPGPLALLIGSGSVERL
jgi:hypothetical protein